MVTKPRTATQIFRQAQHGQLLEHVALIEDLEARAARLEAELSALRAAGGSDELKRLPADSLATLVQLFDAVPIPDLAGWERRQALSRLGTTLNELQERSPRDGGVPPNTWSDADSGPALRVIEGDGATIARTTTEVVRALGEVAGKYFAQMVEFQGTTPDQVSRARAATLLDVSSLVDAKAQYGLLPADSQRALFEQQIDDLIHAKDQLYTVTSWMNQGRDVARSVLEGTGTKAAKGASLLGILHSLAESSKSEQAASHRETVFTLATRYAELLPPRDILEELSLTNSTFQRAYRSAIQADADLAFLANALAAVLDDHDAVTRGLKKTAIKAREKNALKRLAKSHATSPAKARRALLKVLGALSAVEDAQPRQEAAEKALVNRFSQSLALLARAAIEASPNPEASATAFDQLAKAERRAYLASLWLENVSALRDLLDNPDHGVAAKTEHVRKALYEAVGSSDPAALRTRVRAYEVLGEALRNLPEEDTFELTLAMPIDVEEGLLNKQAADLAQRVHAFLAKFSKSKKAGMQTLESAAARLAEFEALKKGKTAALDAVLKSSHRGKRSPKRESTAAHALLDEQRAVDEGRTRIASHKATTFARVQGELERYGLADARDYDALLRRVSAQREVLDRAATAQASLEDRTERVLNATRALQPDVATLGDARAFLQSVEDDARALGALASEVDQARDKYVKAANSALRKKVSDYGAARLALTAIERDLDLVDTLGAAAATYATGFAIFSKGLKTLEKVRTWVRRERKRAEALGEHAEEVATSLSRAVGKLDRGDGTA
jgi:hypothetical protein